MPPIHQSKSAFWTFLHKPDEKLSLKEIVDNLKNYAVVAGIFIAGSKVAKQGENATALAGYFLWSVAIIVAVACFLQTWVLAQKGLYSLWNMPTHEQYLMSNKARLRFLLLLSIPVVLSYATVVSAYSYISVNGG